jgi:threonyl-tRNA synthetase
MMAFLVDAYREEEVPNAKGGTDTRTVLALDPRLAPVKVAVLPLSRNERLSPLAREVADDLRAQGGTSTSTTPAPSAAATAARTRSARRSASRSTSTRSMTAP